jgi:hemerythrin-like domain-containing protein
MDAIALLMDEHQLILDTLDALEVFADRVAHGVEDKDELGRFVQFIREFADARHHGKEEDILFEIMVEAGFPREGGPIAMMLMEHERGRGYVAELAAKAAQAGKWSPSDKTAVAKAAHGYAELLRQHIAKENTILYPMARMRLGPEALSRVDSACAAFEEGQKKAHGTALEDLGRDLAKGNARGSRLSCGIPST